MTSLNELRSSAEDGAEQLWRGDFAFRADSPTGEASDTSRTSDGQRDRLSKGKIPPVVLRDKTAWTSLEARLRHDRIGYNRATNASEGIKIFPATDTDYRKMIKLVEEMTLPWHSYKLPEEQNLKVVLRGIPSEIDTELVTRELTARQFPPIKTIRMTKKKDGKTLPMPLVLIIMSKDQRKIYDITDLLGLKIIVEPLRSTRGSGQCYRCQLHGHAQTMCRAPHRCVRCGGPHMAHTCPKAASEPPTCANCGGQHPANFGGCPKNPRNRLPVMTSQRQPAWTGMNRSQQQATTTAPNPAPALPGQGQPTSGNAGSVTNKYASLTDTLGKMMIQFSQTNPTKTQTSNFANEALKLLNLWV